MKKYRIQNKVTMEWWEGEAESALQACEKAGWLIGDCYVREYSPKGCGGWKTPDELKKNPKGGK